jgi:ribosomal protein S28E/S33
LPAAKAVSTLHPDVIIGKKGMRGKLIRVKVSI